MADKKELNPEEMEEVAGGNAYPFNYTENPEKWILPLRQPRAFEEGEAVKVWEAVKVGEGHQF